MDVYLQTHQDVYIIRVQLFCMSVIPQLNKKSLLFDFMPYGPFQCINHILKITPICGMYALLVEI